jgi:hypothetical protein
MEETERQKERGEGESARSLKRRQEEEKFRFEKKGNKRRSLYTLKIKKHIF